MVDKLYKDSRGHWRTTNERLVWVNPARVRFNIEEIEWLLGCLYDLREGMYVPEPVGGYEMVRRKIQARAYFELPVILAAELDTRLEACGQDGMIVEEYYCKHTPLKNIALWIKLEMDDVDRRIQRALRYMASRERRERTYRDFVGHHQSRKKFATQS